jgi:hypothetical protein
MFANHVDCGNDHYLTAKDAKSKPAKVAKFRNSTAGCIFRTKMNKISREDEHDFA